MSASVTVLTAAKPRNRSIEARRAARLAKFEREKLIVDSLNRGVSVAEIAVRVGVTEKRMRALVQAILARRMPEPPAEFAALQVSRLNEALLVAYGAMSPENLRAVGLVVRIVRELDRYHGFAAAGRRPRRDPRPCDAEAPEPLALEGDIAPSANRAEMAPQAPEKMEFAPEQSAAPDALDAAAPARQDPPAPAQPLDPAPGAAPPAPDARPCDGPKTAPQAPEKIESAPGNATRPVSAEARDGGSANEDAVTSSRDAPRPAPPPASRSELPPQAIQTPESAAATWTQVAFDGLGGVRRVKVRMLPYGVAGC